MAKLMLKAAQVAGQTYDDPSDGPSLSKTNFIPGLTPNARPKLMLNPSLAVRPKPKLRLKPDPMPTSDPAPPPPPPRSPPVTVPTAKSYLPPAKLLQVKWKKPIKRGGGGGGGAFAQQVLNKKRAIIASPKKADMRGKVAEKFAEKVPRTQTLGRPVKNGALAKSGTLQEKGKSALRKKILSAQKKGGSAAMQKKKGITLSHTKYKGMNEAMKVKSRPVKDYGRKRLPLIAPNILEAHAHNQGFGDVYRPQGDVLCSLNCVGQEGLAPSLQCASCLCLFHPTCLGMIGHPTGPFLCTKCACIIAGTKPLGLDIGQHSAYPPGADTLSYSNSAMLDYATSWSYGRAPWEYAVPSWGPDAYHYAAPPNRQFPPPPPLKMAPHAVQASRGARSPPEEYMAAQRLFYAQSHGDASPRQPERGVAIDITFTDVARKRSPVIAAMPVATGTTWQAPRKPGKRVLRRGAVDPGACVIQRLHAGLEVLPLIFRRLSFSDLMSASRVCRIWRGLIDTPTMWKTMVFRGCERFDWKAVTEVGRIYNTTHLDLKGLKNVPKIGYESPTTRWQHVLDAVQLLPSLKRITFGQVPAFVLERMADITELADRLEVVSAEWIIDTVPSPEMWDIEAVMDVGKFGKLRSLQELTLRGLGGIRVAEESSCGGLKNLTCLKRLHTLSMTTLQEVPKEEFQFLAGMDSLVTLELGDCKTWNKETYAHLGQLSGLRHLRLEHGGTVPDTGLADAIANMTRLEHLELIMFTVADTLAGSLHQLRYLHTLTIWPDVQQPALVNTNVFNILSCLPKLEMLDWGVLCETNNNKDCEHDKNCETKDLPSGKPTEAPEVGTKVSEPAGRASRARRKRDRDAKDAGESGIPVGSVEEKSEVKVGEGNADEVRKSEDGYGSPIDETGAGESRKSVVRTDETGIVETIADDLGKDERNVDDSSNDDNDPEESRNSEAKAIEGEKDCAEDVKEDDGSASEVSKSEENVIDAISKDERNVENFRDSGDIVDATRNVVVNIDTTIKSGEANAGDATLGDLNENESVKDVANTDEKETDKTSLEQDGKVNASNSNASCVNNTGDIEADNANKDDSNAAETKIDTDTDEARKDKSVCATKPHGEDSSIDGKDTGEKRETRSTGKDSPGENQQTIHSPGGTALEKPPATGELKSVKQSASTIPFLPGAMYREGAHEQVQNSQTTEYLSVAQLMDSLCTILPETKIRILQIPMLDSAGAPSAERLD
ncbi:PREDICTED: uncharacterized protein LOC106806958 [Priapulus caudatus]|uniref:Uncharacterized protein LOC106806958 n=1 Tax=Priapulus caudatus TaxID=37621 RepID=A0ABM1DXF8_PRICU|nr:PREDICTED: uncharacterized protein LOC106806958 [Priapulus caudatus]